jgi:N-acetylmuramoyl-L-alanine amidase
MQKIMAMLLALLLTITAVIVFKEQRFVDEQEDSSLLSAKSNNKKGIAGLLEGKIIVIDPGHGGRDRGTKGLKHGTIEKELNLRVAKNIREELQKRTKAKVLLTREGDNSLLGNTDQQAELQARLAFAKEKKADLYISIHHDAFEDTRVNGITTYYGRNNNADKHLAEILQRFIFAQNIETRNRGATLGDYMILRESTMPSALIELGFTSNEKDEIRITSEEFQNKSKKGIVDGIVKYFKG